MDDTTEAELHNVRVRLHDAFPKFEEAAFLAPTRPAPRRPGPWIAAVLVTLLIAVGVSVIAAKRSDNSKGGTVAALASTGATETAPSGPYADCLPRGFREQPMDSLIGLTVQDARHVATREGLRLDVAGILTECTNVVTNILSPLHSVSVILDRDGIVVAAERIIGLVN